MPNQSDLKYNELEFLMEYGKALLQPKWGQVAPASNAADLSGMMQVAKKLVQQLKQHTAPTAIAGGEIFVRDLQDLPSFIKFLFEKQVRIDSGLIVSLNKSATNTTPFQIERVIAQQGTGGERAGQGTVYINKDGLVQYLQQLLHVANDPVNPNDVMRIMLEKLINATNQILQTNMSTTVESKDQAPVSPPATSTKTTPSDSSTSGTVQPRTTTTQQLTDALGHISSIWPLQGDVIDLQRISEWCQAVIQLKDVQKDLDISAAIRAKGAADYIIGAWQVTQQPLSVPVQSICNDVSEVMRELHPTASPIGQVGAYLQALDEMLDQVEKALFQFRRIFGQGTWQNYLPGLEEQIQAGSSSLAAANRRVIATWKSQMHTCNLG